MKILLTVWMTLLWLAAVLPLPGDGLLFALFAAATPFVLFVISAPTDGAGDDASPLAPASPVVLERLRIGASIVGVVTLVVLLYLGRGKMAEWPSVLGVPVVAWVMLAGFWLIPLAEIPSFYRQRFDRTNFDTSTIPRTSGPSNEGPGSAGAGNSVAGNANAGSEGKGDSGSRGGRGGAR